MLRRCYRGWVVWVGSIRELTGLAVLSFRTKYAQSSGLLVRHLNCDRRQINQSSPPRVRFIRQGPSHHRRVDRQPIDRVRRFQFGIIESPIYYLLTNNPIVAAIPDERSTDVSSKVPSFCIAEIQRRTTASPNRSARSPQDRYFSSCRPL